MKKPIKILALLAFIAVWTVSSAGKEERDSYVIFQLDNDLFTGSDNDYTNGARLAFMQPVPAKSLNRVQQLLKELTGVKQNSFFSMLSSLAESEEIRYDYGIGLAQMMFTPPDPQALAAGPGQRPYAGWLGAEVSLHAKDENALSSVVFSLGVTGKYAKAQPTQNWVHRNISNSPIFQGWDSQIPTEVTLNLFFDRKRRFRTIAETTQDWLLQVDGYFEWGAMLGNGLTGIHAGTLLRIGYNLPLQYMTPRLQFGNYPHELFASKAIRSENVSVYGFGGARINGVLHNITLDGPVFSDFDTGT